MALDEGVVDGFVETIKTRITKEDLCVEEINLALKKVHQPCTKLCYPRIRHF